MPIAVLPSRRVSVAGALAVALLAPAAQAASIDTENPDLSLRWDNTVKYSNALRLKNADSALLANPNQDDGDRNFGTGLVSDRVDLLSEFDATYHDMGGRLSGAAWYDEVYNRSNDNNSPATSNVYSVPYNHFTDATRDLHGRKGELLDAFVFGNFDIGEAAKLTLRLGRHTVLYGESLFFGANGIANGQAPVDYVKLLSVPNTPFKELIRPVEQVSAQAQVNSSLSLGAYYQFKFEKNRIPGSGSYFSTLDFLGDGAERILFGPPLVPGGGPAAFFRGPDITPSNSGPAGFQVRLHPQDSNTDFGLYAIRYNDRMPLVYIRPGFNPATGPIPAGVFNPPIGEIGEFGHLYAQGVRAYGTSFSTVLGTSNVAGEFSVRENAPLVSDAAQVLPFLPLDSAANSPFAVGKTAHAQVSWINAFASSALWDGATWLGEVAWNRTLSVTRNAATLDPNTTRDALGLRTVFEPTYYQVAPGLDLSVPIGLGYNPKGRSSAVVNFNGGVDKGGDLSIGINGEYRKRVKFGLNYTQYLGTEGTTLTSANTLSFQQALKDRDFISFNVTFSF